MDRARAPGRRLPAGNQGRLRPGPGAALRDGGLLVLLARRQGLLGRRPARQQGARARASGLLPSRVRLREPHRGRRAARRASGGLTVASVYVPNGGKDFPAKMRFLEAMDAYAAVVSGRPAGALVLCGDLNVARTERDVHPKERKAARDRPAARGARAARAHHRPRAGRRRARARSRQRRPVHLVGAVAQHAPAQHRLAARLRVRVSRARLAPPPPVRSQTDVGTSDHAPVVATFA